jgi:coenzyme PQQ precursor peptide PqqA
MRSRERLQLRYCRAPAFRNRSLGKRVFDWGIPCYRRVTIIRQETVMKWTTPKVVEICVGMEINCYACAEL